ncbi:MAG TPA: S1-like domain-containing RNA-binding protein [Bacillota bacterium]
MKPLSIGTIHTMTVTQTVDEGYMLQKGSGEILLPLPETETPLKNGQLVDVFLFTNQKGKIEATMKHPRIVKGTFNWAEVIEVIKHLGVFVDIGITKDILVSKDDLPPLQHVWPTEGDQLYVTLGEDHRGRLLAIPATEEDIYLEREFASEDLLHKTIRGRVYRASKEGTAIITDEGYRGFIHHTERKNEPRLGERVKGRVIGVKEDGTINVSLRPLKQYSIDLDAEDILAHLEEHDGVIPFSDRSDPEDIRATFNISKSAFKRALGRLMKEGKVEQREGHTYLKK